jgi:hypothetical protein
MFNINGTINYSFKSRILNFDSGTLFIIVLIHRYLDPR